MCGQEFTKNSLDRYFSRMVSNLVASCDYSAMKNSDIVIEAVFEDLALKHKVIKQIESIVGPVGAQYFFIFCYSLLSLLGYTAFGVSYRSFRFYAYS